MKTIAVVLCLMFLAGGCISATYNPQTGLIQYGRLGDMEASGILVEIDPNGILHVECASEKNTGFEAAIQAIAAAYQAGLNAGLAAPK
ncbi:MAG: hypothetical protein PHH26_00625 [Candidatus Thermoplasmatota archaeon]|nr:hypothetical protein [Candidatus Thermoplasmatota archaeon]